jgi:hypothetical protein
MVKYSSQDSQSKNTFKNKFARVMPVERCATWGGGFGASIAAEKVFGCWRFVWPGG